MLQFGCEINMIVRKINIDNAPILIINKNEEMEEVKLLEYVISLESKEEYENGVDLLITKLLLNKIKVYRYISNSHTLQYDCNKIFSTNDMVIIVVTDDKNKFDFLQNTIKQFMISHKERIVEK